MSSQKPWSVKLLIFGLAVLLVSGYGGPLLIFVVAGAAGTAAFGVLGAALFLPLAALAVASAYRWSRSGGRARAVFAAEVLVIAILPVWGLTYSHYLGRPECTEPACSADTAVFRPFAEPEVFALAGLHALTALAYAVSRRRPEALRPGAEALLHAMLLAGAMVHSVIAVHIARWFPAGVVLAPAFAPCLAPALTVVLYGAELRSRLRRRGYEADSMAPWTAFDSPYRLGPPQSPIPPEPRVHRRALVRAFALAPALLGLHAVAHAVWLGRPTAALDVVTRTCGHVMSAMDVVVVPQDCHYLCTVAARGHGWLVRPERLGRRRGVTIVVNRQLALANAFEDLLHERWPRFGALARRIYDRLGLPVSRYIRNRWLADLTYVAMKPAEWLFALTLLLLDRGDPERRVERMYRS